GRGPRRKVRGASAGDPSKASRPARTRPARPLPPEQSYRIPYRSRFGRSRGAALFGPSSTKFDRSRILGDATVGDAPSHQGLDPPRRGSPRRWRVSFQPLYVVDDVEPPLPVQLVWKNWPRGRSMRS